MSAASDKTPSMSVSSTEEAPRKRTKYSKKNPPTLPSSVIISLVNNEGVVAGPTIEVPSCSTSEQLEALVNSLLEQEGKEKIPYALYVYGREVIGKLSDVLEELLNLALEDEATAPVSVGALMEDTLTLQYQPLSVYRVRPVTRCSETMPGHTDAVLHVSYSPDGKRLASGGGDMAVRFWNVSTSMPMHTCTGHRHHVLCTGWSPNGELFVSADRSGDIRLWNPATGAQKGAPLRGHRKWVTSIAFEPLHMDPTCSRMATASKDGTIRVWNLHTGASETTISGHTDSVEAVKWGGSGLIYTASRDRTIKVWAIDGNGRSQQKLVRTLSGHAHRINALALNCDYVCRTGAYELGSKTQNLTPDELKEKAKERYEALVGQDGERLVSCSDDFTLFMWKPQTDKQPLLRMTGHQQLVNHIAFSPDGRYLASASFDKKVKLWCGKTGRFLSTLTGHVGAVYQVTWAADSGYLASASKDSTVKVWAVKDTKKALHTLPGHMDEVYTLDWSPNGTQLASGSKDRTIKIWHH